MILQQRWRLVALILIAVVGVSGAIEAWPQASESAGDLLVDAAILAAVMLVSVLLARRFGRRETPTK